MKLKTELKNQIIEENIKNLIIRNLIVDKLDGKLAAYGEATLIKSVKYFLESDKKLGEKVNINGWTCLEYRILEAALLCKAYLILKIKFSDKISLNNQLQHQKQIKRNQLLQHHQSQTFKLANNWGLIFIF